MTPGYYYWWFKPTDATCPAPSGRRTRRSAKEADVIDYTSKDVIYFLPPCLLKEPEMDLNKQPDSPSEEQPTTHRVMSASHNPKYQLFLNNEIKTNGLSGRDADGPGGGGRTVGGENGPRLPRWETNLLGTNNYRGSLECLASRDWDTMPDKVGEAERGLGSVRLDV